MVYGRVPALSPFFVGDPTGGTGFPYWILTVVGVGSIAANIGVVAARRPPIRKPPTCKAGGELSIDPSKGIGCTHRIISCFRYRSTLLKLPVQTV